jgi:hypothetical protein
MPSAPPAAAEASENEAHDQLDDFLAVSDWIWHVKQSAVNWIDGLNQFTHCRPFQISQKLNLKSSTGFGKLSEHLAIATCPHNKLFAHYR